MQNKSEIVLVQEGKIRLAELETEAIKHFHNSREEFSNAMLALYTIAEESLWEFALDADGVMLRDYENASFEIYLGLFCKAYGVSRSSVQQHLKTFRTWKAINRDPIELLDVDVKRADPVKKLVKYDGRSGEFEIPSRDVIDALPETDNDYPSELDEFITRANLLIDEVLVHPAVPLSNADVRKAFTIDVDANKSEVNFFETDGGILFRWETGIDIGSGILIPANILDDIPTIVVEKVVRRLGVIKND